MSAQLAIQTQPDGTVRTLQTVFLSAVDAALLGEYESWLSRERLYRKLQCRTCGRDCDVEAIVEPTQVGIACAHRLLLFQGHVPMRLTDYVHAGEPVVVVRLLVPDVPMAVADVYMLQRYKTFLNHYHLQEALWCLKCEDEGASSGVKAFVTVDSVVVQCRCQRRISSGFLG